MKTAPAITRTISDKAHDKAHSLTRKSQQMPSPSYQANQYDLGTINNTSLHLKVMTKTQSPLLASDLSKIIPWRKIPHAENALQSHFLKNDPALNRFAIYYNNSCVGAISIRAPWLKGPYLELLGLLPSSQGIGIGSAILSWFEQEAPPKTRNFWLLCSDFNTPALKFYETAGYQQITAIEDLYMQGLNDILMRKHIT